MFENCWELTEISGWDVSTSYSSYVIGASAFKNSGLMNATIPRGVTVIDSMAFYNCSRLTTVTVSKTVTSLGSYCFCDCPYLEEVTFLTGTAAIMFEMMPFAYCTSLSSIEIPGSASGVDSSSFAWCTALMNITVGNPTSSCRSDGTALYKKGTSTYSTLLACPPGVSNITVADTTIVIASRAFYAKISWKLFSRIN